MNLILKIKLNIFFIIKIKLIFICPISLTINLIYAEINELYSDRNQQKFHLNYLN